MTDGEWRPLSRAPYPPISDYALISDAHSCALVSRSGSIDWCCMPRMDQASLFGRLLDWRRGGYCSIQPTARTARGTRRYLDGTMVLETRFATSTGEVSVIDCFAMRTGGREDPHNQLLRIVEGIEGEVELQLKVVPRFDYGGVRPWLRSVEPGLVCAIGGIDGLIVRFDHGLDQGPDHRLMCTFKLQEGDRCRLGMRWFPPERLDHEIPAAAVPVELDKRYEDTLTWWRRWSARGRSLGPDAKRQMRSALVLKALSNAPTGAIAAAATTSLPEWVGGSRNWDYRYSWIRDSAFSVRSLADIGFVREAEGFRRFIMRSAAGSARDLQIMYGLGGERRLTEIQLRELDGYRVSRPVRIGNAAAVQLQLDAYGELLSLAWSWRIRGNYPDPDYWRFLLELVGTAGRRWTEPDRGIWEIRGRPLHFTHSKAMCWAALDRGLALAEDCRLAAPVTRWRQIRRSIKQAVETRGYDRRRGVFVRAFGRREMDAALLLLPQSGLVRVDDPRMVRTVDEIARHLDRDGLIQRYDPIRGNDGIREPEGKFVACTFWMVECLAGQRRLTEARQYFDRAAATANDLGLFSEEFDPARGEMLGNFPQGLTHLSHIAAALAIAEASRSPSSICP